MKLILAHLENLAHKIRHGKKLGKAAILWNVVRPAYDLVLVVIGRKGLVRVMNGTDEIRVHPEQRGVTSIYEPDVWPILMATLKTGDRFVDVGAFVGLYAIAATRHVGSGGRVVAYEPDPRNCRFLKLNSSVNDLGAQVEVMELALGANVGTVEMTGGASEAQTHYSQAGTESGIRCSTLDIDFPDQRVDVLKIDVEGFELDVLKGGRRLLRDTNRRPRTIFVEVHPFAWGRTGTTSDVLLAELRESGYAVHRPDGSPVVLLDTWEEVVATPIR